MICLSSWPVYSLNPAITILVAAGSAGEILEAYFGGARSLHPTGFPISPYHIRPEQDGGRLKARVRAGSLSCCRP